MEALQGETQGWGELRQTSLHKLMFSWQGYEQALRIRDVTSACLFLRIRQSSSLLFLLRKPCLTSPRGQWWIWNQWLCMLIPVHPFRRLCMASTTQPGQELFLCKEKKKTKNRKQNMLGNQWLRDKEVLDVAPWSLRQTIYLLIC